MKKLAYAYFRTSTELQKSEGTIAVQMMKVKEFAEKNDFEIIGEYVDDGVSGGLSDRPGLKQLLEVLTNTEVEYVLIYKLDRLARDLYIQEGLIKEFNKHNKQLISTLEPDLDGVDPFRRAFRQMLGVFSEFEKAMINLRMSSGKERQAKSGKWNGGKLYGYDNKDGYLIINQTEADVVKLIFKLRKNKNSYKKIAGILSEMNKPTKYKSKNWWPSTVKSIASNPIYKKGLITFKGVRYAAQAEKIV